MKPILLALALFASTQVLRAQGTAFTYQGRLDVAGAPAKGSYDLTFTLFSAGSGGSPVAGPLTNAVAAVSNGLFTVSLDFGGVFDGNARWLEIAVRTNGASGFATLAPRQPLTPAPYAILAGSATAASTAANVPAAGIGAGTANISITGNAGNAMSAAYAGSAAMAYTALTATTATTATNLIGNVADAQLSANIPRLNGTNQFTGTNTFPGVTIATNVNNIIKGSFTGNGGGLTNLNTAQFANSVLTNGETGVTLGGTFNGNATTATTANSLSGSLSGDVTGTQGATVVSSVGGQSAASVASGASAANAATSAATANTIVKRDASGNFTDNNITLNGNLYLPAATASAGIIYSYSGAFTLINDYGNANIFAGIQAGNLTMTGNGNNAGFGGGTLYNNTTGSQNAANGGNALYNNMSGSFNTAAGQGALFYNTIGSCNTAVGQSALWNNTNGYYNIALGYQAGQNITFGSGNIDIGNAGVASDNNIIRIGSGQTGAFINAASLTASGTLSATNTIYADSGAQNAGALNPGLIFGGTGSSEGISSKRTIGTDQYGLDFYTQNAIRMTVNNNGLVGIGTITPGYLLVVGSSGSPAYCNGTTWVNGSDRNAKEAFTAIDARTVLEKVSALPITEWKYKAEADGTTHLGPMAQDFHAAFGLNGSDDKHIATVDEGGVALAAIQGLNQKVEETRAENAELKKELSQLKVLVQHLAQHSEK